MNSELQAQALETGGQLISKTFTHEDLLAYDGIPSDRNLRLDVEALARKTFGFLGTRSIAERDTTFGRGITGGRKITVIQMPDGEGLV